MNWDRIIEEKIREAQAEGKFKNLPGEGRPLNLDDDPFEDAEWWTANRLLKNSGFRPDWLEDDVELRAKLTQARRALRRTQAWRLEQLAALGERNDAEALLQRNYIEDEWARGQARFRAGIAEINKGIAALNLKVPSDRLHRRILDVEAELQKVLNA
jgi:DnaJ family protein C protein 28